MDLDEEDAGMVGGEEGGAGAGAGWGAGAGGRIGRGHGHGQLLPEGKLAPGTYDSPLHPLRRSSNGTDGSKTSGAGMFLGMGAGFSLGRSARRRPGRRTCGRQISTSRTTPAI